MKLNEILVRLGVRPGGMVFVHSSARWIQNADVAISSVLPELRAALGPETTIVMPALPFRSPLEDFLATRPVTRLNHTPAQTGLLAEQFRRMPLTRRTLDPDVSLSVNGPMADLLTTKPNLSLDPFGVDSPFRQVLKHGTHLVGLGVSKNTMGLIHVIDSMFAERMDLAIYSRNVYEATTIDADGREILYKRRPQRREVDMNTKPGLMSDEALRKGILREMVIHGSIFFAWDLPGWVEMMQAHAEASVARSSRPLWLRGVPSVEEHRDRR